MECSQRPIWHSYTREELNRLKARTPKEEARRRVHARWDAVAKPIDGMGRFETLTAQIGAILGTDEIDISRRAVVMMCADNGIVEEGVSQSGSEVTAAVAKKMGEGRSSVCRMARLAGAATIPIDVGMRSREVFPGVLAKKVRCGTENFRKKPAMTEEEAIRAIAVGVDTVYECRQKGFTILAAGEMGIGNTTTSSAVAASLLGCGVDEVTGRGAGLCDAALQRKRQVIGEAIEKYGLRRADALTVLTKVGGLDIAALAGMCIGGAVFGVPIVLDGVISAAAALAAERMVPGCRLSLLPSHKGKEPAMGKLLAALEMEPVIDGRLALGEGTGAVMLFPLLDMALALYRDGATFREIQVEQYRRYPG